MKRNFSYTTPINVVEPLSVLETPHIVYEDTLKSLKKNDDTNQASLRRQAARQAARQLEKSKFLVSIELLSKEEKKIKLTEWKESIGKMNCNHIIVTTKNDGKYLDESNSQEKYKKEMKSYLINLFEDEKKVKRNEWKEVRLQKLNLYEEDEEDDSMKGKGVDNETVGGNFHDELLENITDRLSHDKKNNNKEIIIMKKNQNSKKNKSNHNGIKKNIMNDKKDIDYEIII